MTDPSKRVEQLEREVSRLADNVRDLERQRDALLRDARTRHDAPPKHHSWIGRLILLSLTAAAASAAYFMFRGEEFSLADLTALGSETAAMETDPWLLACVLCIAAAMGFYIAHRRFLFGFAAMAALYGTHWAYFAEQPAALDVSPLQYFWISTVLLTGAYALLAYLSVHECRRSPKGRRRWTVFAFANSIAFFSTVWLEIDATYPDHVWQFRLFFAVLLTVFAVLAETQGPYRNPVFQLYVAKAVLMTNLALATLLSGPWMALVLALECACLAITFRQSGFVLFKLINLAVLVAAVVYGVQIGAGVADTGAMALGMGGAIALVLLATAALYTHGMPERAPESRKTSGQWTYADTALDLDVFKLAMFHGAGATLILVVLALYNGSESALLPFSLAAVAVALVALGMLGRTTAVEFAGVLVLASAQAAYGYSLLAHEPSSTDPTTLRMLAGALTAVSFAVAWRWDYTVQRDEPAGTLEYLSAIAAPYVAAGLVTATFTWETILPEYAAAVQHVAALGCIAAFRQWRAGGMRIVALTLMVSGAVTFARAHGWPALTGDPSQQYWLWFGWAALAPLAAERVLAYQFGVDRRPVADASRTVLVVVACIIGLVGIFSGAPEAYRAWGWLGMAAVAALCGIVFREGRYRWSAMIAFVAACVLVATQVADRAESEGVYAFAGAALAVGLMLALSWGAAMRRQLAGQRQRGLPGDES